MEKPIRIQRRRTKGWKMPVNTVYVGRPTIFGNPFRLDVGDNRYHARTLFSRWIRGEKGTGGGGIRRLEVLRRLNDLRGKNLACFCPLDQPCHADILLEIANS